MFYWILFLVPYSLIGLLCFTFTIKESKALVAAIKEHQGYDMETKAHLYTALVSAFWPIPTALTLARALAWKINNR